MNRFWLVGALALALSGCASSAYKGHLDDAYQAYAEGDCTKAMLELSRTERGIRSRPYLQRKSRCCEVSVWSGCRCIWMQSRLTALCSTAIRPANTAIGQPRGWEPYVNWDTTIRPGRCRRVP